MPSSAPIAHAMRGGVVDNIYRGSMVIAGVDGGVVAAVGDPMKVAYIRSAGKPLQALTLIELGGAERYGLAPAEIAIVCASHCGGDLQVATVRSILAKAGVPEDALQSGSGIRDNCSGKHAGMLVLAKMLGHPLASYRATDHPIQEAILATVSEMCGLPVPEIRVGVDGCGAPIFAMPLKHMAMGYARLANPDGLPPARAAACRAIAAAMQAHPEMVGGLAWKDITGNRIVAKGGAAGCYCIGFLAREAGFAMKIDDGSSEPVLPAVFEWLARLGYVASEEHERFLEQDPLTIRSRAGELCGEIRLLL